MNVSIMEPKEEPNKEQEKSRDGAYPELSTFARRYRFLKTCFMPLIYICLGFYVGLVSPTMLDMQNLYHTNYEEYAKALMMKAVGVFFGSFAGGIISDRYRKRMDWFLAFSVFTAGAASVAMPWLGNLVALGTMHFTLGICQGILNVVCSSTCIAMWKEKSPLPIHVLHTAFTFGLVLGPIVSEPFITEHANNGTNTTVKPAMIEPYQFISNISVNNHTDHNVIFMPYLITGGTGCIVSIAFFVFACVSVPPGLTLDTTRKSVREMLSPAAVAGGRICYGTYMIISLFWTYVTNVIVANSLNVYLYATAVSGPLQFSKHEGTLLNTMFFVSSTVGRGLGGVFSHFFPIQVVLHINVVLQVICVGALTFIGLTSPTMLWVWVCCSSFFSSPVYPAMMAWADRYIEVTGFVVCVIDTGIGLGGFVSQFVSGVLIQRFGPQYVYYLTFTSTCAMWALLVVMQIICSIQGDRYKSREKEENKKDHQTEPDETSPLIN